MLLNATGLAEMLFSVPFNQILNVADHVPMHSNDAKVSVSRSKDVIEFFENILLSAFAMSPLRI